MNILVKEMASKRKNNILTDQFKMKLYMYNLFYSVRNDINILIFSWLTFGEKVAPAELEDVLRYALTVTVCVLCFSCKVPSNAQISTPFFRKQCFSLKYVLVTPLKNFGRMSKFGIYVIMKSSLQF